MIHQILEGLHGLKNQTNFILRRQVTPTVTILVVTATYPSKHSKQVRDFFDKQYEQIKKTPGIIRHQISYSDMQVRGSETEALFGQSSLFGVRVWLQFAVSIDIPIAD